MEPIDITVEYPSGLQVYDRAGLCRHLSLVEASERFRRILSLLDESEAPPLVTASIDGQTVELERRIDGAFYVDLAGLEGVDSRSVWPRIVGLVRSPTKDQRQQFGRFLHTLSAASLIGAIGYLHTTSGWTVWSVLNAVELFLAFVVTFYIGMVSINGE